MYLSFYYCFFFFFSSRRRHTRSLCDWSSDVCSSDLDCSGAGCADLIDELCNQGARPRPLTESVQTYFVDGDDDRRRRAPLARRQFLIAVEPREARRTDDGHVLPQNRYQEQRKQGQTMTDPA